MQQPTDQKPLSFIDVLTRNLFLFTVMCVCVGFGVVISFLDIESLDSYYLQIRSSRLDFIFFIGMAACYVSLILISIGRYWLNFTVQIIASILVFVSLVFIFSPPLKIKSYLFNHSVEFSTRPWYKVQEQFVGKHCNRKNLGKDFSGEDSIRVGCISCDRHYYFFSFVFTSYDVIAAECVLKNKKRVSL